MVYIRLDPGQVHYPIRARANGKPFGKKATPVCPVPGLETHPAIERTDVLITRTDGLGVCI